jgi:hypothetical protein
MTDAETAIETTTRAPEGRCQVCGAPHGADEPILCRVCGEPVLLLGWAP